MRLSLKLILAMLFVAVAPVGLAGFQALDLSRTEVEERIREILSKTSVAEAEIIGRDIVDTERSLLLVASALVVDPDSLTNLSDDLSRVYLLSDRFNAAALFDERGRQIGPIIFVDDYDSFSFEYQSHEDMNTDEMAAFLQAIKGTSAESTGCFQTRVYHSTRKQTPLMICSAPVIDSKGQTLRLVVELSLNGLQKRFEVFRVGKEGHAFLVDENGKLVFHPRRERALRRESLVSLVFIKEHLGSSSPSVSDYSDPELGDMIGAFAPVPDVRWAVVVAQPRSEALAPVQRLGSRLISWLLGGLALALALGLVISRRIVKPVGELVQGALAIASGDLRYEIRVRGKDEIAQLGKTFNHMGTELARHRRQIEAQSEEIRRWNVKLQDRVDRRTRELKEVQDQLIQAKKMAAVGELGAGVAHEINNPLMGVIGCAQLLASRHPAGDPDHDLLVDIEREANRIRDIVDSLLKTSQRGEDDMTRVDLARLVDQVAAAMDEELKGKNILVEVNIPERFPSIMGDAGELDDCLVELLTNASHAMPDGGTIRITGTGVEGEVVKLAVSDTGVGIPQELHERIFEPFFTTKQNWDGKGLGLARVFQVVERHRARIGVTSSQGRGATFTLTFPALRRGTHLR